MAVEQACKFEAGIAGCAESRGFKFGCHHSLFKNRLFNIKLYSVDPLCFVAPIFTVEAYLSIMMHKYSYILNGLAELSSFSDGYKKKFLLDSAARGHLVWWAIVRELETCEYISCRISRRPSLRRSISAKMFYRIKTGAIS
jgi:hypothetical protein